MATRGTLGQASARPLLPSSSQATGCAELRLILELNWGGMRCCIYLQLLCDSVAHGLHFAGRREPSPAVKSMKHGWVGAKRQRKGNSDILRGQGLLCPREARRGIGGSLFWASPPPNCWFRLLLLPQKPF